jgi:L-lactate dehydrogenase (cytochrome)
VCCRLYEQPTLSALDRCTSYDDYRRLAKRRIPRTLFDYLEGGSFGETTMRRNVCDLAAIEIEQRIARDMSKVDIGTDIFGRRLTMPAVLAPVGFAGMYARRGEVQAARAAAATGIPFCLSTVGICSADELATANLPFWYQLYIIRDRGVVAALLDRVQALGCETLVVTVDLPTPAPRYHDIRSGMSGKLDWLGQAHRLIEGATHPAWVWDVYVRGRPHAFGNLQGVAPIASNFADAWN